MEQQHSKSRVGQVITVFATFLAFMGIGVVDPILAEIAAQIGASHWQVEMLFTSYLLMMAIMMIPAGILASRFGDKRLMVTGLIIVTIFAALSGMLYYYGFFTVLAYTPLILPISALQISFVFFG